MEDKTIEKCFEELNDILTKLEKEDTGLEESFKLYREGLELCNKARQGIDRVEKELKIMSV